MTRKKKPDPWPPVGLRPRLRFAELEEHEQEHIRSTLASYEKFGAYDYDQDGQLYSCMDLTELLLAILRHVQEVDGAPARCRNRQCRKGRCHMYIDDDDAGVCPGGVRKASIDKAGVDRQGRRHPVRPHGRLQNLTSRLVRSRRRPRRRPAA